MFSRRPRTINEAVAGLTQAAENLDQVVANHKAELDELRPQVNHLEAEVVRGERVAGRLKELLS